MDGGGAVEGGLARVPMLRADGIGAGSPLASWKGTEFGGLTDVSCGSMLVARALEGRSRATIGRPRVG